MAANLAEPIYQESVDGLFFHFWKLWKELDKLAPLLFRLWTPLPIAGSHPPPLYLLHIFSLPRPSSNIFLFLIIILSFFPPLLPCLPLVYNTNPIIPLSFTTTSPSSLDSLVSIDNTMLSQTTRCCYEQPCHHLGWSWSHREMMDTFLTWLYTNEMTLQQTTMSSPRTTTTPPCDDLLFIRFSQPIENTAVDVIHIERN